MPLEHPLKAFKEVALTSLVGRVPRSNASTLKIISFDSNRKWLHINTRTVLPSKTFIKKELIHRASQLIPPLLYNTYVNHLLICAVLMIRCPEILVYQNTATLSYRQDA